MNQYKNEIIIFVSFILMISAWFFKQAQIKQQTVDSVKIEASLSEVKSVIGLMNLWKDKKIVKKVLKLKSLVSPSKVKWHKKSNTVTTSFKKLSSIEVNRLMNKILNIPIEIVHLKIAKMNSLYNLEFKCKW